MRVLALLPVLAAGGLPDTMTRIVGVRLSGGLGPQVVKVTGTRAE